MGLLRIDNKTLSQKVYDQLKQRMISAELRPGQRISLRELAVQLGVSLTPVRQALWQLERDKAVVVEHNRQILVNRLGLAEFDEILELRLMMECKAADEACRRRPESAPAIVKAALEEMWRVVPDSKQFLHHNHDYHMLIYSYSGMANLLDIIDNLWTRVGPYIYLASITEENMKRSMGFHTLMLEAFGAGDPQRMVDALRLDLTIAAERIRPLLHAEEQPARAADEPETTRAL